ncbi:hypothetical protein PCE1_001894 [Barthelona sp. PCE]
MSKRISQLKNNRQTDRQMELLEAETRLMQRELQLLKEKRKMLNLDGVGSGQTSHWNTSTGPMRDLKKLKTHHRRGKKRRRSSAGNETSKPITGTTEPRAMIRSREPRLKRDDSRTKIVNKDLDDVDFYITPEHTALHEQLNINPRKHAPPRPHKQKHSVSVEVMQEPPQEKHSIAIGDDEVIDIALVTSLPPDSKIGLEHRYESSNLDGTISEPIVKNEAAPRPELDINVPLTDVYPIDTDKIAEFEVHEVDSWTVPGFMLPPGDLDKKQKKEEEPEAEAVGIGVGESKPVWRNNSDWGKGMTVIKPKARGYTYFDRMALKKQKNKFIIKY